MEMGVDGDGRILAMRAVIHADIGAYVRTAGLVPAEFGASLLPGPYRVPNYECDLWSVVTNKTPAGTLRSPGPTGVQLRARAAAGPGGAAAGHRCGRDPPPQPDPARRDAVRLRHQVVRRQHRLRLRRFPALFDELLRRLDYPGARAEQAAKKPGGRGRGAGSGWRCTSRRPAWARSRPRRWRRGPTGASSSIPGPSSMGPGLETVLAQILGDALGLPAGRFDVRHADTAAVESGVGTYGSRGTVTAGNAAHWRRRSSWPRRGARGRAVGVPEAEVTYAAGELAAGGRRVTLADLARRATAGRGRLVRGAEGDLRGLRGGGRGRRGSRDRRRRAAAGRGRRRRGPRGESRARRGPAGRRRRVRHRQHDAREPRPTTPRASSCRAR